jgi:predicted RNase H-like nuclease (RuvC/YqgF family)
MTHTIGHRSAETIKQNREEIEQAIDEVKGKDADIEIQKIWKRVLK